MKLLDEITVQHQGNKRSVQLFVGDLSRLPAQEAVDVLVVSAFPDDYLPTRTSLIGAFPPVQPDVQPQNGRLLSTPTAVSFSPSFC